MLQAWFVLSAATALLSAFEGAWAKKLSRDGFGPHFIAWSAATFTLPILVLALWREPPARIDPLFWPAFAASLGGNTVAILCYFRAFALGELSIVFPLLALTPALMLLSTHAITGEFPSPRALAGIGLLCAGCYGLGLGEGGPLSPFRRLWRDPGARNALYTSLLWSVTSNCEKAAVEASSRFFLPALHGAGLAVVLTPLAWRRDRRDFARLRTPEGVLAVGALAGIAGLLILSQFSALALAQSTYVIAIKRAGMIPAAWMGWKLFGEAYGPRRLAMSLVAAAGLFLMV